MVIISRVGMSFVLMFVRKGFPGSNMPERVVVVRALSPTEGAILIPVSVSRALATSGIEEKLRSGRRGQAI